MALFGGPIQRTGEIVNAAGDVTGLNDQMGEDPTITMKAAADLEHAPGFFALMGWTTFRGTQTILRGPYGGMAGDPFSKGTPLRNWGRPRNYGRYRNLHGFEDAGNLTAQASKLFDPGSRAGYIGRKLEGSSIGNRLGLLDNAGNMRPLYDGNLLARTSAAGQIARGGRITAGGLEASRALINRSGSDALIRSMGADDAAKFASRGAGAIGSAHMLAPSGTLSQKFMGYASTGISNFDSTLIPKDRAIFAAARRSALHNSKIVQGGMSSIMRAAEQKAINRTIAKGTAKQVGKIAVGKAAGSIIGKHLAAKGAAFAAGPLMPFVQIGLAAWDVYSIAKLGGSLLRDVVFDPMADALKAGIKSFKGQIDKSPFGMGYVDNEVAATSRARGVMAIQNSRLNARSLLGNEASMLHAHFG